MNKMLIVVGVGITVLILNAVAQDGAEPRQGPPGGGGKPPTPPIEAALDANSDGTIDADEIANAPAALKKLDKNSDGKLTVDEYRPAMPRPRADR